MGAEAAAEAALDTDARPALLPRTSGPIFLRSAGGLFSRASFSRVESAGFSWSTNLPQPTFRMGRRGGKQAGVGGLRTAQTYCVPPSPHGCSCCRDHVTSRSRDFESKISVEESAHPLLGLINRATSGSFFLRGFRRHRSTNLCVYCYELPLWRYTCALLVSDGICSLSRQGELVGVCVGVFTVHG